MSVEPLAPASSPGPIQTLPMPTPMDTETQVSPPLQTADPQHGRTGGFDGSAALPERDSAPLRAKGNSVERGRRHSADGETLASRRGHFQPYQRQLSDGGRPGLPPPYPLPRPLQHTQPHAPVCFQGLDLPEPLLALHSYPDQGGQQRGWNPYRDCVRPTRGRCTAGVFSAVGQSGFSLRCLPPQPPQDNNAINALYPKPVYSYSILIFMALQSSRTGSLPVSEIYSFMTEHFPYFKTAPDGWKNSVRHNLSLNKCFEKVENRSGGGAGGGASRKGCLWALNPSRVEKMMEELHKWRRKDPLSASKSMAHPEELGRLLGEDTDTLGPGPAQFSLPSYLPGPAHLAPPVQTLPSHGRLGLGPSQSFRHMHAGSPGYMFGHAFQSPATPPFLFPSSSIQREAGSQETPPYSSVLQAQHSRPRSMQELLLEGESCTDIDTLNPSLTDLQLQGKLWEELRDDSLAPDSLQIVPTADSPTPSVHSSTQSPCGP